MDDPIQYPSFGTAPPGALAEGTVPAMATSNLGPHWLDPTQNIDHWRVPANVTLCHLPHAIVIPHPARVS